MKKAPVWLKLLLVCASCLAIVFLVVVTAKHFFLK